MIFKRFIKESLDDMDRRCEKCDTLLNDMGTCPKCDEGEEDYGDNEIEVVEEELSNIQKLKRAYPELNIEEDKERLTEATGSDLLSVVKSAISAFGNDNDRATKVSEVLDVIPDSYADELFVLVKEKLGKIELDSDTKSKFDIPAEEMETVDTVEDLATVYETTENSNPHSLKEFLTSLLTILAVIEPTPILEVILAVVAMTPDEVIEKIASFVVPTKNEELVEELTVVQKLKRAFPELNIEDEEPLVEDTETDEVAEESDFVEDSWYDDEYEMDDVEQDRAHAALYGGDRMYCDCGHKLAYDESGSYCPECSPRDFEEDCDESLLTTAALAAAGSIAGRAIADKLF